MESHHYEGKASADSGTNLHGEQETSLTEQLCVGVGDVKPSGPNYLGTRHDFIHFVVFWFSLEDHYISN